MFYYLPVNILFVWHLWECFIMLFCLVWCQKWKLYVTELFPPLFLYLSHLFEHLSWQFTMHTTVCTWTWTSLLFISFETFNFVRLRLWNFALSEVRCKTTAQADIVLLVDGSWSIGRLNFKTIRAFIARMVGVFDIGPERVQIGGSTQDKCIYSQLVITNKTGRGLFV